MSANRAIRYRPYPSKRAFDYIGTTDKASYETDSKKILLFCTGHHNGHYGAAGHHYGHSGMVHRHEFHPGGVHYGGGGHHGYGK